ncbi:TetR/AcrR family transcriptional regulator [Spirillospora sp. CA-142024]|uniref:TetR/AcrR family transcriptional regulator n=1 Tax=unclassified Spirillospora TaxID=2642701 RepID=UPI003D8C2E9A
MDQTRPRRQARGERRIAGILTAAADVFARMGYEKATTNAIAAEAGVSPGSLYQFFPNKEAIAGALADRFVTQVRAAYEEAFGSTGSAGLSLDDVLDRAVDPMIEFNLANPGFKALFARPDMPAGLAKAVESVHTELTGRVDGLLAARAPDLPAADRARTAEVAIRIFQAMVPLVVGSAAEDRPALIRELKKVLHGYLAPVIG